MEDPKKPGDGEERRRRLELLATCVRKRYGRDILRSCGLDDIQGKGIVLVGEVCTCEFEDDPDDPDEHGDPWHFRRVCPTCTKVWWSLHCVHDLIQRPCPDCGEREHKE